MVSPGVDAEPLLAVLEDVVAAAERAGQRAAHPDLVLADGVLVEERVEGDDALDVRRAELEALRHELDDVVRHPVPFCSWQRWSTGMHAAIFFG